MFQLVNLVLKSVITCWSHMIILSKYVLKVFNDIYSFYLWHEYDENWVEQVCKCQVGECLQYNKIRSWYDPLDDFGQSCCRDDL